MPASGSAGSLFFLSKSSYSTRRRPPPVSAPRRETHNADFVRVDTPFLRVRAHHPDGLLHVIDFVGLRIVAVAGAGDLRRITVLTP